MVEALSWESRPLDTMYPIVFFDALLVITAADLMLQREAARRQE